MKPAGKDVSETCRTHDQLQGVHKMKGCTLRVVSQLNRNEPANPRVINTTDAWMLLQMPCQHARVFTLPVHSHRECLQATQNFMSIPNTKYATHKLHHADKRGTVKLIA